MNNMIPANAWLVIMCPQCGGTLIPHDRFAECKICAQRYEHTPTNQIDLRLRHPKDYSFVFPLGAPLIPEHGMSFDPLQPQTATIDLSNHALPDRLSREIISYFPKATRPGELMLDLGCGNAVHREICELTGFDYVGIDYEAPGAPMLADAHALPFADNSFEFVLSIAVLEHIRYPFVMVREAFRVLKPGGRFIGTVAFLEPFHADSFYHHSHLGVLNVLQSAGFSVDIIAPSKEWDSLRAQASMGLFLHMPRWLSHTIVEPVRILNRIWYWLGYALTRSAYSTESRRILVNSGAQTFVAHKPMPDDENINE